MKARPKILLLVMAAAFVAQPCFAQLRSVLQIDGGAVEHVASLNNQYMKDSSRFRGDRMIANHPSTAPSVLLTSGAKTPETDSLTAQPISNQPQIQIQVEGSHKISTESASTYIATIENPSDKAISQLQVTLSPNSRFKPALNCLTQLTLDRLEPRFKAHFEFKLVPIEMGSHELEFTAVGSIVESNGSATSQSTTKQKLTGYTVQKIQVEPPTAIARLNGPSVMYLGTDANYAIKITNPRNEPLQNVFVSFQIPQGLNVTILDRLADVDNQHGLITWHVPVIQDFQNEIIQFRAKAVGSGQQVSQIGVMIGGKTENTSKLTTNVVVGPGVQISSDANGTRNNEQR